MLPQLTCIAAVEWGSEAFPLAEAVPQYSRFVIRLPYDTARIDLCGLVSIRHLGQHTLGQTVIRLFCGHLACRVQTVVMAVIRAPPYAFFFIFVNQPNAVIHLHLHAVVHRLVGGEYIAVEAVQTVPRAEPYEALLVLQDGHHRILAHAVFDGVVLHHIVLMRPCAYKAHAEKKYGKEPFHQSFNNV